MPVASTRQVVFLFVSALIMTTEGSSAPVVPESVGGSLPIANLKALLKDSLSEILKENPSFLQPPGETQRGELASFVGGGGGGGSRCINRLCPGVVSEAKWRGCRVLWTQRSPGRGTEYAVGVPPGAAVVMSGSAPRPVVVGRCLPSSPSHSSHSVPSPPSLSL